MQSRPTHQPTPPRCPNGERLAAGYISIRNAAVAVASSPAPPPATHALASGPSGTECTHVCDRLTRAPALPKARGERRPASTIENRRSLQLPCPSESPHSERPHPAVGSRASCSHHSSATKRDCSLHSPPPHQQIGRASCRERV